MTPQLETTDTASAASKIPTTACFACGLLDAQTACRLPTPLFTTQQLLSAVPNEFIPLSLDSQKVATRTLEEGEAKLLALRAAIKHLQGHVDDISRAVGLHRNFIFSICALPDEILLVVFAHLSAGCDVGPWTVSAVCKRWRSLAIPSSHLWTRIEFGKQYGDIPYRGDSELVKNRVEIQLERAGDHHLQLFLDTSFSGSSFYDRKSTKPSPYEVLLSFAERCRTLELHGWNPYTGNTREEMPVSLNFSALRSLRIDESSWLHTPGLSSSTSLLTDLTFECSHFDAYASYMHRIDFSNLKRLTLVGCSLTDQTFLGFLQDISAHLCELHLDSLSFTYYGFRANSVPGLVYNPYTLVVQLPSLRHLSYTSYSSGHGNIQTSFHDIQPRSFFSNLQAPQLRSLHIAGPSREAILAFASFIRPTLNNAEIYSRSHLKELTIDQWSSWDLAASLVSIVREAHALESLTLRHIWSTSDVQGILEALHWPLPTPCADASEPITNQLAHLQVEDDAGNPSNTSDGVAEPVAGNLCPKLQWLQLGHLKADVGLLKALIRSRAAGTWATSTHFVGADCLGPAAYLRRVELLDGMILVGGGEGAADARMRWEEEAKMGVVVAECGKLG